MAGNLRVCALKHMKNSMYKRKNGGKYMEKKKTDTETITTLCFTTGSEVTIK